MGSLSNLKKGEKPESNNNNQSQGPARVSRPQSRTPKTLKINGKTLLIKEIESFMLFFTDSQNREDIITLFDHYIRTYMNTRRKPWAEGGITDRRNKRMIKLQETFKSLISKL